MRKKIIDERYIKYLSSLCIIVYFVSYITRLNFSTVILEIANAEGFLKSSISVVVTVNFFSYAIGQLIIGFISKKIKSRWLIFNGILFTSMLNLLIPFCTSISCMVVVWLLNGFAQAMLWIPMIKILAEYLKAEEFKKTIVNVNIASLLSTIFIYLISPIIIYFASWRMIFYLSAVTGFAVTTAWYFGFDRIEKHRKEFGYAEKNTVEAKGIFERAKQKNPFLSINMLYIVTAVLMRGVLKDGITAWIPSFIYESYNIPSYFSVLMSMVLPVSGILSVKVTYFIYNKLHKDEILVSAILFGTAAFAAIALRLVYSFGAPLALFFAAIITSSANGVGLLLLSILPLRFEEYGKVASVAGILNFFVYVSSAISTYGMAKLTESYGWNYTILSWSIFALMGFIPCYLYLKTNKK